MSATAPSPQHRNNATLLSRAFLLTAAFSLVEVTAGVLSNSLTLLADAGHMVLDASALGLAWFALRLSLRPASGRLTYGYHRVQVLAAFLNGLMLAALVVWILSEAYQRFLTPEPMTPLPALVVASIGLLVNLLAYRWLHHGKDNINVQAAALHVLGDLLGSVAAIAAALTVHFTGWTRVDPLLALVIAAVLARGAWRVLKTSGLILLEGAPTHLDQGKLQAALAALPDVLDIHHVHIWCLTPERPLVTLHARVTEQADPQAIIKRLKEALLGTFGVAHSTIQLEVKDCPNAAPATREEYTPVA